MHHATKLGRSVEMRVPQLESSTSSLSIPCNDGCWSSKMETKDSSSSILAIRSSSLSYSEPSYVACWSIRDWDHDLLSVNIAFDHLIVSFWSSWLVDLDTLVQRKKWWLCFFSVIDYCCLEETSWSALKWMIAWFHFAPSHKLLYKCHIK